MPEKNLQEPLENRVDPLAIGTNAAETSAAIDAFFLKKDDDKPADDKPADDNQPDPSKPADDKPAAGDAPAAGDKPAGDKPADDKPAAGDKPAGDKPAGDKPVGDKPADDKPAAGDKPADDKPAAGDAKPAAGDKPADGQPAEIFPEIKLPANSRGESAKAFATVKLKAQEEIGKRDTEITTLRSQLAQAEEKAKKLVPSEEVQKLTTELQELRQWRAKLDLKADPAFNEKFDGRIQAASDFIMNRVKASGKLSEAALKKITDMGGPGAIEWDDIFKKMEDPQLQRLIQTKLDEIETAQFERDRALEDTGKEIDKYVEQRREEFKQQATAHTETTKLVLEKILSEADWMKRRAPTADATPEQKAAIEDHNKFIDEVTSTLGQALSDDSAHMRAVLLSGIATHMHMRRAMGAEKADLTAKVASAEKERDALKAQVAELQGKLDAIKRSGSARRETNAPAGKVGRPTHELSSTDEAFKNWEATRAAR